MPTKPLPDRLMPLAVGLGVRPMYGDIHNHCNISYGHGSLVGALNNAQRQLDFVSVTGHAYWPDMPVDEPAVAHIVDFHVKGFARLAKLWPGHFDTLREYHDPGRFTVFPGYEMHSSAYGDYTILLKELDQHDRPQGDSPVALKAALRAAYDDRAMAFPHHIGYRTGARGINWKTFDGLFSPVVELVSMHGCAESSLTDRPFLHSMGPCDGPNTVHNGWNEGHVFGVLGNTDHHSGYPGSYGHGRSALYALENTSASLWQALNARHSVALTGDNCHLFATLNGAMPGDIVSPMKRAILNVEAVGGSFIDCIDLLRNGTLIQRITPAITPKAICVDAATMETILVLELGWGERNKFHDWSGKLRIAGGQILAVEPRLRGPEIVSPLEGHVEEHQDTIEHTGESVCFSVRAHSNPNNSTPSMQSIAMRVRFGTDARIVAELCGQQLEVDPQRLVAGALSGNLGTIDSPAYRFLPLPTPEQWQWTGQMDAGTLVAGDWVSLRMRQSNSQWAWSSAFFCR